MVQTQKKWTSSYKIWRSFSAPGSFLMILAAAIAISLPAQAEENTRGNELFQTYCGQCHGDSGQGFRDLYPALTSSPYLDADVKELPCIIRYGIRGNILLESGRYNQSMPGNKHIQAGDMALLIGHLQTLSLTAKSINPLTSDTITHWLDQCPKP